METPGRPRRRTGARPGSAPVLVTALLAWPVLTAGFTRLLHSSACIAEEGMLGFLAAHVARMRPGPDCPPGTLGIGPQTPLVLGTLTALGFWLVLAHVAAAALGMWLAAAARGARAVLTALVGVRRLPGAAARVPTAVRAVVDRPAPAVGHRFGVRETRRRGPPVPAS